MMEERIIDPSFLTTKEVAELLRVKERKVYDLAGAGEIPHRRITGKLLFPRAELMDWIEAGSVAVAVARPNVLTGSHDPLLDWAVRDSGSGLATLFNGSGEGLSCFAQGHAALTGMHVPEAVDWNVETVTAQGLKDCVLIAWATRTRGLVLSKGTSITSFTELKGKRVVRRQPGAGAATFFDGMLSKAGMRLTDMELVTGMAHTEYDAAAMVAVGQADAAPGIEAMARQFNLDFLPLTQERFDLVVDRRAYFTEGVQKLFHFASSHACKEKAEAMGGYDLSDLGAIRWVSP